MIIRGKHMAEIEGYKSYRERIFNRAQKLGLTIGMVKNNGDVSIDVSKDEVYARIDFGRWIADCVCGGAEYVDYDDPVFFCLSCGNSSVNKKLRPVVFPNNYKAIEKEILKRPVKTTGIKINDKAMSARPQKYVGRKPLSRSWNPNETLADIKAQNKLGGINGI